MSKTKATKHRSARERQAAARRYEWAEDQLQRVQDAIIQGIRDREAYLTARTELREAHAQVLSYFGGPGKDPT